jgi:large repetitive protein
VPPGEVTDGSVDDFSAGSTGGGAYVARTRHGEVLLAPKVAGEFTGEELPEGWSVTPWVEGGTGTLKEGMLHLDGARAGCEPLLLSPRSLEFVAVFAGRPDQQAGFGTDFVDVPWVMFSTKWGRRLYGRTHLLNVEDKRLPGHWFDEPHRFRIEWNVLDIVFSIDGDPMGRILVPVPGYMRALAGNKRLGGEPLRVEWMRVSPYAPSGSFTSRVLDAGTEADWGAVAWDADVPAATSIRMHVRTGAVDRPDGSWSAWRPLAGPGDVAGTAGRFLQYRADLATTDSGRSPVLRRVVAGYSAAGDSSRSSGSGSALGCQ